MTIRARRTPWNRPSRIPGRAHFPTVLLLLTLLLASACRGGHASAPASQASPSATDIASPATATSPSPDAQPAGPPAPDGQRAYKTVRQLAVAIGPRLAGTPGEVAARDELSGLLRGFGYDVTLQDFGFDASDFLPARVDAGGPPIPAFILRGSASGTARGRLVDAGSGRPEDIPPGGLTGAIALVERGGTSFSEKAGVAIAAGAVGIVVYNNQPGNLLVNLSQSVTIPVVGIRQDAGRDLAARLAVGTLDAAIAVSPAKGTAYNVVAKPKGVETCATVTGGHYDSVAVTDGADDNASGAAAAVEVARVMAARHTEGANCFVLFSAEEFGLFGSRAFVDALSPAQLSGLRAMVNLDVVGVSAALELIGDDGLVDTARIAGDKAGIAATKATLPMGAGSDHLSFQRAGVPVVMLTREDNLIHTPDDEIGRVSAASLGQAVTLAVATLGALGAQ